MSSNTNKKLVTPKKNSMSLSNKNRISDSHKKNSNKKKSKLTSRESNVVKTNWSMEDVIESMKPSDAELKFREEKLKENDILEKNSKFFKCTKCSLNFNSLIQKHEKIPVHPVLGVLMCQSCCDYYEDGEFSLDSEGEDKYCRWCGEGGTIFGCAKCIFGFCTRCIKRHFKKEFKKVQNDDNWLCFICNPQPLWTLRLICSQAIEAAQGPPKSNTSSTTPKNITNKTNTSSNSLPTQKSLECRPNNYKRIFSDSSDESENETQDCQQKKLKLTNSSMVGSETEPTVNEKPKALKEMEKLLKLSEHQLNFGASWCNEVFKKLGSSDFALSNENLASECKKIKWFFSLLSTYLVQYCNSLNAVEKSLIEKNGKYTGVYWETKTSAEAQDISKSPFVTILQFLDFMNVQIKMFMEKGISMSDIIKAEIYDDENIIGIKKKLNSGTDSFKVNNIDSAKSETNNYENNKDAEEEKVDNEGKTRSENGLDVAEDEESETNSTEHEKELNNSIAPSEETPELQALNQEEDIQEILAILENA